MRGKGMEQRAVEDALTEVNESKCEPPLPSQEMKAIAASVCDRYIPGKRSASIQGSKSREEGMAWMKIFPSDELSDRRVALMPDYQLGWRWALTLEAWRGGAILPSSMRTLATLARASDYDRFCREAHNVLDDFEATDVDGKPALINTRMSRLYEAQVEKYRKKLDSLGSAMKARNEKLGKAVPEESDGE
jgi:hypothetical protein